MSSPGQPEWWASQGFYVFPCLPGEKKPHPEYGQKDASNDPEEVRRMFAGAATLSGSTPNVGLVPALSGHVAVDVDGGEGERNLYELWERRVPSTLTWSTGRGRHLLYALPDGTEPPASRRIAPDLDVKTNGYVLVPPSVHPSGARYQFAGSYTAPATLTTEQVAALGPPAEESEPLTEAEREALRAPSLGDLRELAAAIPNGPDVDRDEYVSVAHAVKGAAGDDPNGLGIFLEWAGRYPGADQDHDRRTYETIQASRIRTGWPQLLDRAPDDVAERYTALVAQQEFEADPAAEPADAPASTSRPFFTRLSDVKSTQVEWLWDGRIPLGKITMLDGDPGLGKSGVTLDLAARVSKGRPMPCGEAGLGEPAGVVLISSEDGLADTVRPRLDAAGADPSRILHLARIPRGDGRDRFITVEDVAYVRGAVREVDAKLVVIDPLMAFLGTKDDTDSYRDQDVRSALLPIADLAEEEGSAVLMVRHLTKGKSTNALYRGGGSMGIIGAARCAFLMAESPQDPKSRVLVPSKNNLGPKLPAMLFRTESVNGVLRIAWTGTGEYTATDLLDREKSRPTPSRDEAKKVIRRLLSDGPKPVPEIKTEAKSAGISFRTFQVAKNEIGVQSLKRGFDEGWVWALPEEFESDPRQDDAVDFLRERLDTGPASADEIERAAGEAGLPGRALRQAYGELDVDITEIDEGGWEVALPDVNGRVDLSDLTREGAASE